MDGLKGIDVSKYQGNIDWRKVAKDNICFALIKASEGTLVIDPKFQDNWHGAQSAGLACEAYHFYRPNDAPKQQAQHFLSALSQVSFGKTAFPAVIDCEVMSNGMTHETYVANLMTFIDALQLPVMIYGSPGFLEPLQNHPITCGGQRPPLWVAEYTTAASPHVPAPWKDYAIWQYGQGSKVNGIQGEVDLDVIPPSSAFYAQIARFA